MMRTKHGLLAMVVMTLTACATPPVDQPPSLPSPSPPTGGIPVPPNLPAPSLPAPSVPTSESGSGEATTADERRDVLDKSLDDSLGEFDKTLEEEQRRTAAERDARTASTGGVVGAGAGGAAGEPGAREGDLRSERGEAAGQSQNQTGDRQDRGSVGAGSGAANRGVESGNDDDIVARRLRRAAEQETDPELKEKLWKEYQDYKRNSKGG
ncbi:MAG: hypothetical protein KJS73_05295 [Gammaproteobacteria bacterium]|nr:hypothetical protein [Gammaproteobacteria bacterium]